MNAADAIQSLAASLGLADATSTADGACGLVFEDGVHLTLEPDPERDSVLHAHAVVGALPEDAPREAFEELLRANYLGAGAGGAVFSLDRERDEVLLALPIEIAASDLGTLSRRLADFVGEVGRWTERLRESFGARSAGPDGPSRGADLERGAFPEPGEGSYPAIRV